MKIIVCDIECHECMIHCCQKYSGKEALTDFVTKELSEIDNEIFNVQQWQSNIHPILVSITTSINESINLAVGAIDELTTHYIITRARPVI